MKTWTYRHVEAGFTLVEIMAVVFIIGIMVGLAAISINGHSERLLQTEAQRLFQKIRLAVEEAEYSQNEFGLSLKDKNSYQFFRFDEQLMEWVKLDKDFFQPVEMDDGFEMVIDTAESELDTSVLYAQETNEKARDYGEKNQEEPEVIFFSDGQITPFKLSISNKYLSKNVFVVSGNSLSGLNVQMRE
jgi:general secretion pathway protein H